MAKCGCCSGKWLYTAREKEAVRGDRPWTEGCWCRLWRRSRSCTANGAAMTAGEGCCWVMEAKAWVELDRWGTGMVHSVRRGTCGLMICGSRGRSAGVFRGVISAIYRVLRRGCATMGERHGIRGSAAGYSGDEEGVGRL